MSFNALRAYENKLSTEIGKGENKFYDGVFGKQILEIGFGKAELLKQLVKQGNKCYGIEASKLAILNAEEENINANLILLDVSSTNFPYQDGHFDIIYIYNVIEFLENPLHCFSEIKRVLKSDGELRLCFKENENILAYPGFIYLENIKKFVNQLYFKIEDVIEKDEIKYIKAINKKLDKMEILDILHNEIDQSDIYKEII